ncbi:MAG: hypothetical protein H5T86_13270, partial [Armatimonadetes bacterium]|nr:hypothetical protein [Armatimonadota bacterium]
VNGIAVEICKRGVEIVQIDQVVGGSFQWCYSRHHPHPPGPGPWMTEAFRRQLATMLSACRSVERDAIIGFEEPNEYFNQQVAIQDYRDTEAASANPPAEPASVFGYLYHEYLPCFQSNPQAGDAFGLAYCLVTGQIPHFVPLRIFKPGPALVDGGFEEWRGEVPRWWEKVSGWQGKAYDGRCFRAGEAHSGRWCLGLECTEQGQIVQVAQNVLAGDGLSPGRKYAVSAWAKSKAIAESCSLLVAALAPGPGVKVLQGWSAQIPKEGDSWAPIRVELVLPENTSYLRIMLHLVGPGQAWFDDVVLEEVLPDGTLRTAMRKGVPAEQKLLEQWVRLFSGPGRDFLLLGQMRHPPRLDTDHVSTGRFEVPAILHNQFRAADGREAVVLANWTGDHRTGTLYLRTRELPVSVEPLGVLLLDAKTGRPIQ